MVKLDSTRLFHTLTTKADEYHLKQRNKIETLFSFLKGAYNLVTTRARSVAGYSAGIYASLFAVGNACATIVLARWDNALEKDVLDEVLNKPKSS